MAASSIASRSYRRHGACPRGATIVSRAVSRGSTGTSPAEAIAMYTAVTGHQSSNHRDKPGGVAVAPCIAASDGVVASTAIRFAADEAKFSGDAVEKRHDMARPARAPPPGP